MLKEFKRKEGSIRPRITEKDVLLARFRPSAILDRLMPERACNWIPIMRRPIRRTVVALDLEDFCFLTNPDDTLGAFRRIAELEGSELRAQLNFKDGFCRDAGAYLVLAEVWPAIAHSFSGGEMSFPVQKVLRATGVGDHARMSLRAADLDAHRVASGKERDVWAFPLRRRRAAKTSTSATVHLDPQTREKTADEFVEAVDGWLGVKEIDLELTQAGRAWLSQIIGELLCNAERHSQSGGDGDWTITAFMERRRHSTQTELRCHLAFLSVGRSFAETLAGAHPDIREKLREYTDRHAGPGQSTETLATLLAIQDTITCDPAARESLSGGTGLQDVLAFVGELTGGAAPQTDPMITVVSGRSCVRLRHPYVLGRRGAEDTDPRLLWCNRTNSMADPPDRAFVFDLAEHFAGTLVSVAFTLDSAYFDVVAESKDEND